MLSASLMLAASMVVGQAKMDAAADHLKVFEPFIGTWCYDGPALEEVPGLVEKGKRIVIHETWEWILDKNGVEQSWVVEIGATKFLGKALVGWDPAENRIVVGGVSTPAGYSLGEVAFSASDKTLTIRGGGVDWDARKTSNVFSRTLVNPDTVVLQVKDRKGGPSTGDSPKYTLQRCKCEKR